MKNNRICIFAHYDRDDIVDDYVYYYLNELLTVVQKLVFVTVSDIGTDDIERLESLNIDVIKRKNIGYDFYSYKVGIESLNLEIYDELIISNDSVYGPLFSMKSIFEEMENKECDFWGITASEVQNYHIQSYFIVFRSSILEANVFLQFWQNLKVLENKQKLVNAYEVGLSQILIKEEFISSSYVKYDISLFDSIDCVIRRHLLPKYKVLRIINMFMSKFYWNMILDKKYNVPLAFWKKLILKYNMPFIKKSLFTNDQEQNSVNKKYNRVIGSISNYPLDLIAKNVKRILK